MSNLKPNAKILDASCGNGIQATALAKEGFNITATDISEDMLELAKKYASSRDVHFPIMPISWQELPTYFKETFDLVFCWGNSISHSPDEKAMINNFQSFYKITAPGGRIIIETRNWDKLIRDKIRFENLKLRTYKGKQYIPFYIWNIRDFNQPAHVEIILTELMKNNETRLFDFKLDFTPFRHEDLINRLEAVNFIIDFDSFDKDNENYYIVAKKENK